MNYELLNRKLNQFLEQVSAEELIEEFKALGYEFERCKSVKWEGGAVFPVEKLSFSNLSNARRSRWEKFWNNSKSKNTTPSYSGFFLLKLAA